MHHFLSRPDWLTDVNDAIAKHGRKIALDFDEHWVLVENDWASGYEPEDVGEKIAKGEHRYSSSLGHELFQALIAK